MKALIKLLNIESSTPIPIQLKLDMTPVIFATIPLTPNSTFWIELTGRLATVLTTVVKLLIIAFVNVLTVDEIEPIVVHANENKVLNIVWIGVKNM